jgi:hypothetical protein
VNLGELERVEAKPGNREQTGDKLNHPRVGSTLAAPFDQFDVTEEAREEEEEVIYNDRITDIQARLPDHIRWRIRTIFMDVNAGDGPIQG